MMRILFGLWLSCALAAAADLNGTWNFVLVRFGEEVAPAKVKLQTDGSKLTGTLNELKLEGTIESEGAVRFKATRPNGDVFGTFEGHTTGDDLAGTVKIGSDTVDWKGRRYRAPQNPDPKTVDFIPTQFHRKFSGSIEPAMHIRVGDTIRTTTVDAGGFDGEGKHRSNGGNPETGPFYVDGAMPGDTLAVKFTKVRLNRDTAQSGSRIVPSALDPGYQRNAKFEDKFDSEWKLDRSAGYAMLAHPTERLKNYRVKLQPMMGCVGVAPGQGQSFASGWLGDFGGNMDFNGMREGVTVYLPINQPGALLFIGDGHAAQGDGELTGDALETSMDVEFTVQIVAGQDVGAPRAESDEFLMALGIAGSLPDALRTATTRLARWLEADYHLTPNETAIVLGSAIQYNVAELVDPQVHVVAKINKEVLATIPK